VDEFSDVIGSARDRAVDAFMGEQHASFQPETGTKRAQRLAQFPEIRKPRELIESSDLTGHGAGLSGGQDGGNPNKG
jgi:hypothetical protein